MEHAIWLRSDRVIVDDFLGCLDLDAESPKGVAVSVLGDLQAVSVSGTLDDEELFADGRHVVLMDFLDVLGSFNKHLALSTRLPAFEAAYEKASVFKEQASLSFNLVSSECPRVVMDLSNSGVRSWIFVVQSSGAITLSFSEGPDEVVSVAIVNLADSSCKIVLKLPFDSRTLRFDEDACSVALKLAHLTEIPRPILVDKGTKLDALALLEHAVIDGPIC